MCFCQIGLASPTLERADYSLELLDASDISMLQSNLYAEFGQEAWENQLSLSFSEFSFDYRPVPFDLNGVETDRTESNLAFQLNSRYTVSDGLTLLFGGGAYNGYNNYRSAWLDEYFRQQFSELDGVSGNELYDTANPKGYNLNAGARWMYQPNTGYAQITLSQLQDDIAPGYEIDFVGLPRGETVLATSAISVSSENILTKRIRSLVTVRGSQTSARAWRYGAEVALNVALHNNWIARGQFGGSTEDPQFDAYYTNLTLEFKIRENLSAYLDGRYYDDTGEIENSLFTSAAPGVSNRKAGIGIKWNSDSWSGRVYVARVGTRYDPPLGNVDFFQNLYKDRDWTVFQLAFGKSY